MNGGSGWKEIPELSILGIKTGPFPALGKSALEQLTALPPVSI